jgi:hypothetical protein
MAKNNNLKDFLTDVANAIRYVKNSEEVINPQSFSDEIREFKVTSISVELTSDTTLSGDDLTKVTEKQNRLTQAIENTIIDGELVYKISAQKNTSGVVEILFYTEEGDTSGYYYLYNTSDNYLSKIN